MQILNQRILMLCLRNCGNIKNHANSPRIGSAASDQKITDYKTGRVSKDIELSPMESPPMPVGERTSISRDRRSNQTGTIHEVSVPCTWQ